MELAMTVYETKTLIQCGAIDIIRPHHPWRRRFGGTKLSSESTAPCLSQNNNTKKITLGVECIPQY